MAHIKRLAKLMEAGTIIGDKAYSVQYIADAPRYADYLPTLTGELAIGKFIGTCGRSIHGTKLYTDNTGKCNGGLCYIQYTNTSVPVYGSSKSRGWNSSFKD